MSSILSNSESKFVDELTVLILAEMVYETEFFKSESPDMYSEEKSIGIEVTRAMPIDYERHNGEMLKDMRGNVNKGDFWFFSSCGDINEQCIKRIVDQVISKMRCLVKYKKYNKKYLYIDSSLLNMISYDMGEFLDRLKAMKNTILYEFGLHKEDIKYEYYDKIVIKCCNTHIVWDWENNLFFDVHELSDKYTQYRSIAVDLVKNFGNNQELVVNNTPYKCIRRDNMSKQ